MKFLELPYVFSKIYMTVVFYHSMRISVWHNDQKARQISHVIQTSQFTNGSNLF